MTIKAIKQETVLCPCGRKLGTVRPGQGIALARDLAGWTLAEGEAVNGRLVARGKVEAICRCGAVSEIITEEVTIK